MENKYVYQSSYKIYNMIFPVKYNKNSMNINNLKNEIETIEYYYTNYRSYKS